MDRLAGGLAAQGLGLIAFCLVVCVYPLTYDTAQVKLTVLQMGVTALAGLWLMGKIEDNSPFLSRDKLKLTAPFLCFLAGGLASFFLINDYPGRSLDELFKKIFYILLVLICLDQVDCDGVKKILRFLFAALAIACFYGLIQWMDALLFSGQEQGLDIFAWRLEFSGNIFSTLANPNFFANFLILMLPVVFVWAWEQKKFLYWLLGGAALLCLILTRSKGGLLGLGAMIAAWISLQAFFGTDKWTKFFRQRLAAFALLGGALLLLFILFTPAMAPRSTAFRILTWLSTHEMIRQAPFLGQGLGSFKSLFPAYKRPISNHIQFEQHHEETQHAENEYLELWAEEGILGLGLYLWILALVLVKSVKALRHWKSMPENQTQIRQLIRHPRESGGPVSDGSWIPACAGMTGQKSPDFPKEKPGQLRNLGQTKSHLLASIIPAKAEIQTNDTLDPSRRVGDINIYERSMLLIAILSGWVGSLVHNSVDVSERFASGGALTFLFAALALSITHSQQTRLDSRLRGNDATKASGPATPFFAQKAGLLAIAFVLLRMVHGMIKLQNALPVYDAGEAVTIVLAWLFLITLAGATIWAYYQAIIRAKKTAACLVPIFLAYPMIYFWGVFEADAHFNFAMHYSKAQRWKEAMAHYDDALKKDPSKALAWYYYADSFALRWDMKPQNVSAWGDTLGSLPTDFDRALKAYEHIGKHFGPYFFQLYQHLGELFLRRAEWGKEWGENEQVRTAIYKKALENYHRQQTINPIDEKNYYQAAYTWLKLDNFEETVDELKNNILAFNCQNFAISSGLGIFLQPEHWIGHAHVSSENYIYLANAYLMSGDYGRALRVYQGFLRFINPNEPQIKHNLTVLRRQEKEIKIRLKRLRLFNNVPILQ